ncbi:MAG: ECF transporter S component [Clostridia bacterium]|nr:ECF transporter S component [Clostridia bacterium]
MSKLNCYIRIAVLSAIGFILINIEFPILPGAPFLKLNLSEVPVLLAAFSMGPIAGAVVAVLQNLLHLLQSKSGGVGEIANIVISSTYAITAGLIYLRIKTRKGACLALLFGSLAMIVAAGFANLFIMLPLYGIPAENRLPLIQTAILPFNFIKAAVVFLVTWFLYKPLSSLLKGKQK